MSRVIVLRPEPAASRTADGARAMGLDVAVHPLFAPQAVAWTPPPPEHFDALLLTSANGVRLAGAGLDHYRALPAYAVGEATAQAMKEAGFAAVTSGSEDGSAIARRIADERRSRVLHLSGTTVAAMETGPLHVTRVAVYSMIALPPAPALKADAVPGSVLLVHSPRAGERVAEQFPEETRAGLHIVAIGAAAARVCGDGWASVTHPARPRDDEMLALARRLCE
ncbi:uroporphyrinogen-III synthase [Sphingobium amiense]|uniref:Uroporphyrinogen-III synthase n=1 Tax=Sphingobium amiense TaxID=135719 RepID=A0A494W443_9SPHN|nr:uroporphyrinogen-III synthase [Sphingobium amiense]BBD99314.1 uroporphyrinogen-III synthase [Sphingobium amiense]